MLFQIPPQHVFPDPRRADPNGLLGLGGDLHPERLLLAYQMGIFPWFSDGQPILWWSPDPRMVLAPTELTVPRSLVKRLRQVPYRLTTDTAFEAVLRRCALVPRPGQDGTWITEEMVEGYTALHEMGHAHSMEAWLGDELVGGLYGVAVGRAFCGESMFADRSDASKIAFVTLVRQLSRWGLALVDCQVHTPHLARFGAREIPRESFLGALNRAQRGTLPVGTWTLEANLLTSAAWASSSA